MEQHIENAKHFIDGLSVLTIIGTFFGWMPNFAAFLAAVWYLLRLYDRWVEKGKAGRGE